MKYTAVINGINVQAVYTEENVREIFLPLLGRLSAMQREKKRRLLVMLAAPPGAGKSTLADFLQALSRKKAGLAETGELCSAEKEILAQDTDITPITVIGMDGFHRRQEDLLSHTTIRDGEEIPLVRIKGAPVTFDLVRLTERIRRVRAGEECGWPEYSRLLHNPVEDALIVKGDIVLLEGNYLLLDREGWRELADFADYTIRITADEAMLKERLVERKIKSGTEDEAARRFVEFSVFGQPATIDWSIIGDRKELDVLGSHLSPYCYPFVIRNIGNGSLKTDGVVSAMFPIEQWEEAFDHASGKYGDFKVAIRF